jgi:hypothetical protein
MPLPFDVNPGRNMLTQSLMGGQSAMPMSGGMAPQSPPGMGGMPPGLGAVPGAGATPGMGGGMGTPPPTMQQPPMGGMSPMAQAQPRPLGMFDPGRNSLQQQSPMGGMFGPRR